MSQRLDRVMVDRSLARSRSEAADLINAGEVTVNNRMASKSAYKVAEADVVEVLNTGPRYVSRAGHKLAGALEMFADIDVTGMRCLDAGASTGGFTDVLLQAGAAVVVAVDVGHHQLAEELRHHRRVHVHEGLNIREITPQRVGGVVDVVVSDLSFISMQLVMRSLAHMCEPNADLVLMVKPQFEVGRAALPRTGVVKDPEQRRHAVNDVIRTAVEHRLRPIQIARSTLPGQDGNVEFFLHLRAAQRLDEKVYVDAEQWVGSQEIDWS